jgi:hypothetical protein
MCVARISLKPIGSEFHLRVIMQNKKDIIGTALKYNCTHETLYCAGE